MRSHMLKHHVGVPLAVFAVLILVGVPVASAAGYAVAAGCVSMVFMMVGGGHSHHVSHHRDHSEREIPSPRR